MLTWLGQETLTKKPITRRKLAFYAGALKMLNKSPSSKKKSIKAALLSALLCTTIAGALLVNLAKSQPMIEVNVPIPQMSIESPTSTTFSSNNLTLTFWSNGLAKYVDYSNVKYSDNGKILGTVDEFEPGIRCSFPLTNLAEGEHTVSVTATVAKTDYSIWYAEIRWEWVGSVQIKDTVTFTVDTVGPRLVFRTPQNKIFSTGTIAINFTAEEPLNTLSYSLDGQGKLGLNDHNLAMYHTHVIDNYQITLSNLMEGAHSLQVYAKDSVGNMGESETLQFTVGQDTQPSETFPTTLLIATVVVAVVVIGAGLQLYFKKSKR
jgi:hypothetical protein